MDAPLLGLSGAFVAGAFAVQQLPSLPDAFTLAWLPVAVFFLGPSAGSPRYLLAALFGAAWAATFASLQLDDTRTLVDAGPDVTVSGRIGPDVRVFPGATGFVLETHALESRRLHTRIRVRWYRAVQTPRAGERWQLRLRIRPLSPRFNPGGFDRIGWAFRQGIAARAYVLASPENRRLDGADAGLAIWRGQLAERIEQVLGDRPATALVQALAVGERRSISSEQWRVFRNTGTAHLMAISGLHIGLVAGLAFVLMGTAWRFAGRLPEYFAAPRAAAVVGLSAALGYAALAGFSLPTQRALGMCAIAFTAIVLMQRCDGWRALLLTLGLISLWHPPSLTDPSLWLSAGAVAALLFGLQAARSRRRIVQLLNVQWVAALGLAPLGLLVFGYASAISPLANLVAVPVVALGAVPLILAAIVLLPWPALASVLLELAAWLLDLVWAWMIWCDAWTVPVPLTTGGEIYLVAAVVGVVVLLSRLPGRWVAALWLLPATLATPGAVPRGEFEATVFDVGQGLAVLVRTAERAVLYDTAGAFGHFSVAHRDLTPALHRLGVRHLDHLIVSHADLDHAGGVPAIVERFKPTAMLGRPRPGSRRHFEACRQGQHWHYDGVRFDVLHPLPRSRASRNNGSCVVMVSTDAGQRMLLTGDIEAPAEAALLARAGDRLPSAVLVVPHHGSRTSSSAAFVGAVAPEVAIVSAGLRNRFGFPHTEVVRRYIEAGTELHNTATDGAVRIRTHDTRLIVTRFADRQWRYWHFMTCARPSAKLAAAYAFRVGARRCWN